MSATDNIMENVKNPGLVKALEDMKKLHDRETEGRFVNEVRKAVFLIPADVIEGEGDTHTVKLVMFRQQDGFYFPLFTDKAQYELWSESDKHKCVAQDIPGICRLIRQEQDGRLAGAIIDPYGASARLTCDTLMQLEHLGVAKQDTKIMLGTLAEQPAELVGAIKSFAAQHEVISKAYLRAMKREDEDKTSYLLVVDIDAAADLKQLFDGISEQARPYQKGTDMVIVPADSELGKQALAGIEPFYVKS